MVRSYLQSQRPNCTIESYYTAGTQKKIDCFNVNWFCWHCKTIFEAMGSYFYSCACREARLSISEEETQKTVKKWQIIRTKTLLFAGQRMGLHLVPSVHISKQREKRNFTITLLSITRLRIKRTLCTLCFEEFPSFFSSTTQKTEAGNIDQNWRQIQWRL